MGVDELVRTLQGLRHDFAPELSKAARFVLEHPNEVSMSSIRKLAAGAGVKPNAFVRLAHAAGFSGFEDMREVFRERMRKSDLDYPDRARRLQVISNKGQFERVHEETASRLRGNLDTVLTSIDHDALSEAARRIVEARRTRILGVGVTNSVARNFAYVASMAIGGVQALPQGGMLLVDGLAHLNAADLLIAMTVHPYRTEVVEAVGTAHDLGLQVIAISDSPASPIMPRAAQQFVVPVETNSIFVSTVALTALFEMLTAYVVAEAGEQAVTAVETFHLQRTKLGVYYDED
jgi:DNA-binding MurR/RpiR family transcriptional regulator